MAEYDFHFTAEVMDGIFGEVIEARGAWDTLGERLDNIEQGTGGDTYTKAEVDTMFAESAAGVTALEQMNGKKNWINVNATSQTVSTLDFTVNADNTILVNGSQPSSAVSLTINDAVQLPQGDYVLLDGYGASSSTLNITLFRNTSTWTGTTATNGKFEFTANGTDTYYCRIYVNTAVDNVTFKPMIIPKAAYDAGFTDYQPYAPTNRELYEMILALQSGT
jgi:hypothetical protein